MRREVVQKGEVKRITGSFDLWYTKHNLATGTIAAATEDTAATVSLTQTAKDWEMLITGAKEGRALIKITADTATSAAKDMQLVTVEVRDQASAQRDYC